jgi:hypothetical protein
MENKPDDKILKIPYVLDLEQCSTDKSDEVSRTTVLLKDSYLSQYPFAFVSKHFEALQRYPHLKRVAGLGLGLFLKTQMWQSR